MNDQVLRAILWDGTGLPPLPPPPPREYYVDGLDIFGTVRRQVDADNKRLREEYERDTRQYQMVMDAKRRQAVPQPPRPSVDPASGTMTRGG